MFLIPNIFNCFTNSFCYSSDLIIFIIYFISSFEIAASAADIPAYNPNGNKTLLARGVSTLFINGKLGVINSLRNFKNPPS